jgi:hypothetical protein
LKLFVVSILAGAVFVAAPATPRKQTLIGIVSDNMCALTGHAAMRMGPTDAECAVACADLHGATYVLVSGKTVYTLSDQKTPAGFAGQRVRVVGTLDEKKKTILVESIAASQK